MGYKEAENGVSFVDGLLSYLRLLMRPEEHGHCSGLEDDCHCAPCMEAARVGAAYEKLVNRLLD